MYVSHLELADYRSYTTVRLRLEPGVSTFVGPNGQGKTNLVEAIGYIATLTSHRVATDAPLVRKGADRAILRTAIVKEGRQATVELEINPGKANRARLNRSPVNRPRDVLGTLRTVLFAPEDLSLVKGDPGERRRFLDELLVARAPRHAGLRSDYERVLKQRNTLLKTAAASYANRRSQPDLSTLEVWDEHLATTGAEILAARLALVAELRPLVATSYVGLTSSGGAPELSYRCSAVAEDETPPDGREELAELLRGALHEARPQEIQRGVSLVGPHRDDLWIGLGGLPAKGYASQGECWSLALSLRLAAFELLRAEGDDPVLMLDDVFAELDADRRRRLAEHVADAEQVLVSAAVAEDIPAELDGTRFLVAEETVERE